MIHLKYTSLGMRTLSSAAVALLIAMTGCAGFSGASFPDASTNPQYGHLGTISGSDFGGHAPLVGAHVYVL
jgi:hypothetical protein